MSISTVEIMAARASAVSLTDDEIKVELSDGRTIIAPLAWYPRLLHASVQERNHWRLIGHGEGIHWPDLDEDVSVANLLAGRPAGESPQSLKRWLEKRNGGAKSRAKSKRRPG